MKGQQHENMKKTLLTVGVATGLMTIAAIGCSPAAPDTTPVFRIIAVDSSGSAEPDMVKYRRFAYALIRDLGEQDGLRVLRFDHDVHEVLRTKGLKKEVLLKTLVTQLEVPATRASTRMAKLYERIAEIMELPEAQGKRIELFIMSDNGNDDASPEMEVLLRESTERIASDPRLTKVTYWGIKTRLAEGIPAAFTKLPPDRLSVQFNSEAFAHR